MLEDDGFEIIERTLPSPPAPTPAASTWTSTSARGLQPSVEAAAAAAPMVPVGALVLELGGDRKRSSSAAAIASAEREKPRLLLFLHRSDAGPSSSSFSNAAAAVWRPFGIELADEQATLPWRTVGRSEEEQPRRPAGDGHAALRALHELVTCRQAEVEWTLAELAENTQRLPVYQLVLRVALRMAENGTADAPSSVPGTKARKSDLRDAPTQRKHLLYALRRDDAACKKDGFSVSRAAAAEPTWLLQDPDHDGRTTLRELYNSIPAPPREPWLHVHDRQQQQVMRDLIEKEKTSGISTTLFDYQRRTVAQLLRRERNAGSATIPDPRLVACTALDGTRFFVNVHDHTTQRSALLLPDMAGSILSEHMGLGKTLECITLIMLTRGERSTNQPPGRVLEAQDGHISDAEEGHSDGGADDDPYSDVPFSAEHSFLCQPHALERPTGRHHAPRVSLEAMQPLRIYRTATTLVCVPVELLNQWMDQLEEHLDVLPDVTIVGSGDRSAGASAEELEQIEAIADRWQGSGTTGSEAEESDEEEEDELIDDEERAFRRQSQKGKGKAPARPRERRDRPMRVLVLVGSTDAIPAAHVMARFDIILLTSLRLQAEWDRCGGLKLRWPGISRRCHCSYSGNKNGCSCGVLAMAKDEGRPISALMQLMFRRIIVDEGHILANGTSRLVLMARAIDAQSRVMVSGTPTANLVGSAPEDIGKGLPPPSDGLHCWSTTEAKDLERVGLLLQNFFLHPVFLPQPAERGNVSEAVLMAKRSWTADVLGPFNLKDDAVIADVGSVQRVRDVLDRCFVRSGNEARDEVALPRCVDKVVELTMNAAERATYNAMQALIGLNAMSGATFFDKGNERYAAEVIRNLKLSTFWLCAPELDEMARHAVDHPGHIPNATPEHLELQQQAFSHIRKVVDEADTNGRLGSSLRHFAPEVDAAIAPLASSVPRNQELPRNLTTASVIHLRKRMHAFTVTSEAEMLRMMRWCQHVRADEASAEDGPNEAAEEGRRRSKSGKGELHVPVAKQDDRQAAQQKARKPRGFDDSIITQGLLVPTPIAKTKFAATSSTKLAYVLDYVHKLPPGDKLAVFSAESNIRTEVADLLVVAQIPFAMHSMEVNKKEHRQMLHKFRKDDGVRVIIMDFHSGGRGHNMQVANHCLLLEPVWSADQELQAIKRFHRLGQTKEVFVTTLVMKNTFEAEVVARRRTIKREQADGSIVAGVSASVGARGGKATDLLADSSLRNFLSRARYITAEHGHTRPEPFTRYERPIYPFAHLDVRTRQPLLAEDREAPQPLRPRGPSAFIGARRQNLAALQLQHEQAANSHGDQGDERMDNNAEPGPSTTKRARFA